MKTKKRKLTKISPYPGFLMLTFDTPKSVIQYQINELDQVATELRMVRAVADHLEIEKADAKKVCDAIDTQYTSVTGHSCWRVPKGCVA